MRRTVSFVTGLDECVAGGALLQRLCCASPDSNELSKKSGQTGAFQEICKEENPSFCIINSCLNSGKSGTRQDPQLSASHARCHWEALPGHQKYSPFPVEIAPLSLQNSWPRILPSCSQTRVWQTKNCPSKWPVRAMSIKARTFATCAHASSQWGYVSSVEKSTDCCASLQVNVDALNLDSRAKEKLLRLAGRRYDEANNLLTIVTDRWAISNECTHASPLSKE